jgi:hypothetical protein
MINPQNFTIDLALVVSQLCTQDWKCVICLEPFSSVLPQVSGLKNSDAAIVTTRVRGDKHHFHRVCIIAWSRSLTPHLNM